MKQTIFHLQKSLNKKEILHKVDFIYDPNPFGEIKIKSVLHLEEESIYMITHMIDEFTSNESVQIRHVHGVERVRDENLIS